jgi:hypothetical protein
MTAPASTPWAVICPKHGRVYLTHDEYVDQLDQADDLWRCTKLVDGDPPAACGLASEWDGDEDDEREGGEG